MNIVEKISENLLNIIKNGECYTTEFKEATVSLQNLFLKLFVECLIEMEGTFFRN